MQRMTPPRGMVPLGPQVKNLMNEDVYFYAIGSDSSSCNLFVSELWRRDETASQCACWTWDAWHEHVSVFHHSLK